MTATYDGHLIISGKTKRILPCCETMDEVSWSGILSVGMRSKSPVLTIRIGDRRTKIVSYCPFCSAPVEVVP